MTNAATVPPVTSLRISSSHLLWRCKREITCYSSSSITVLLINDSRTAAENTTRDGDWAEAAEIMIPSLIDFRGSSVSEQNEHNGRLLCTKRSSCGNINIYEDDKIKAKILCHVWEPCWPCVWLSEQCFTSTPTQHRLHGRRFLQVKRPNQQYQSTEGDATRLDWIGLCSV